MTKEEIIEGIEELPKSIGRYKLCIYEDSQLEPWGQICLNGAINHAKLNYIFDDIGNIRHYDFDDTLEYQFTINYDYDGIFLFKEPNFGKLPYCLETISHRLARYYDQV